MLLIEYILKLEKVSNTNLKGTDLLSKKPQKLKIIPNFLNIQNSVEILMAVEHLQIRDLLEYCLNYFIYNINAILLRNIEVDKMNCNLIKMIVQKLSLKGLEKIVDVLDKITSRIYKMKITLLLSDKAI